MQKHKPLKRDPQLIPLSHDHHDGLVFCLRLSKNIGQADPIILKKYIRQQWNDELLPHFEAEEHYLLPHLSPEYEFTQRFLSDHRELRELYDQIDTLEWNEERVKKFAYKLQEHIRFEERQLFTWIQKTFSQETLQSIGASLQREDKSCTTFYPEFWK